MIELHSLYSRGFGLIDAHLLASCLITQAAQLWTRDNKLRSLARHLGVFVIFLSFGERPGGAPSTALGYICLGENLLRLRRNPIEFGHESLTSWGRRGRTIYDL